MMADASGTLCVIYRIVKGLIGRAPNLRVHPLSFVCLDLVEQTEEDKKIEYTKRFRLFTSQASTSENRKYSRTSCLGLFA